MIRFDQDLSDDDKATMLVWRNHGSVRRFSRSQEPIAEEAHYAWLKGLSDRKPRVILGALRLNRLMLGVGRLDFSHSEKTAEFSIYLSPDEQGKGYAVDAMRGLMDFAFGTSKDFKVLWGVTHEDNVAARKTFYKAGMKADGLKDGPWVRYSIVRGEWQRLPQLPA